MPSLCSVIGSIKLTVHSYIAAYLPSTSEADRRNPDISPFYANLENSNARLRSLPVERLIRFWMTVS